VTKAEEEGHEFREVTALELRESLSELLRTVEFVEDEILITRNGKRVAALISMRAFRLLQERVEELEDAADESASEL
jgi:prevent-host-death family protein